jgi:ribosomal protein S18 acetylase RimI-like enzyme
MTAAAGGPQVRPIAPTDLDFVREELSKHWGSAQIWSVGRRIQADELPGFVAELDAAPSGLATYEIMPGGFQCELVTISSRVENCGIGAALLATVEAAATSAGCCRMFLSTTNDNLRALGFYQKRGWKLAHLYAGLIDEARKRKPVIPTIGMNGIPLRDEIVLEKWLVEPLNGASQGG